MFFAGWAVAATFLPRLADLYGRKKIYICSLVTQFIFYLGIILSRDIKLTTAFNFFMGMASVGRASISYLYAMELIPKSKQPLIGTTTQIFNSFVTLFSVVFFYYISKQWQYFELIGLTLNGITVLGVLFLPESPKYLLTMKRYDDLREAFSVISRFNKKGGKFNGFFERELESHQ